MKFGLTTVLFLIAVLTFGNNTISANLILPPGGSCSHPNTPTQSASANNVQATALSINFQRGDGQQIVVAVRAGQPVEWTPTDDIKYRGRGNFGTGDFVGNDTYLVLAGYGNSIYISGLEQNTTYHLRAFEFNQDKKKYCYALDYLDYSFSTGCGVPEDQSSAGQTNTATSVQATIQWTNGSGSHRLVAVRENTGGQLNPQDNTPYNANATYGLGDPIDHGFVVYNGTENQTTITGLQPGTEYRADITEYNQDANNICYGYSLYSFVFQTDCASPSQSTTNINCNNISSGGGTVNFTRGDGDRILVLAKANGPVDATPEFNGQYDADDYGSGSEIGNGNFVVYEGDPSSSFYMGGLESGTSYSIAVFEYNYGIFGNCYAPAGTGTLATQCDHPNIKSTAGNSSSLRWNAASISFTSGSGTNQLVVVRPNNSSLTAPQQNTTYSANPTYGLGAALGNGFVVSSGTDTTIRVTGLERSTTYIVDIFEFNLSGGFACYNYSGAYTFSFSTIEPSSYAWTPTNGTSAFSQASNWYPDRFNALSTDTLIFNQGGNPTISQVPTETVAHIEIKNQTTVTFLANENVNLNLGDGGSFYLENGSELELNGSNNILLSGANNTSFNIFGNVIFNGTGEHCLVGNAPGSVVFKNGSSLTCESNYNFHPFGNNLSPNTCVIFEAGSKYKVKSPNAPSPFGISSPNSVVVFNQGSRYVHQSNATLDISGRNYATLVYDHNGPATLDNGSGELTLDTLIVKRGNLRFTGAQKITIEGKMEMAGGDSLVIDPSVPQDIDFTSTFSEMANNGGKIRLGRNARMVVKQGSNVAMTGSILVQGDLLNENTAELNIGAGDSLKIEGNIENYGTFHLADDASLIQTEGSEITNNGVIYVTRNIPDGGSNGAYYYWSSPVTGGAGGRVGNGGVLTGNLMYKYTHGSNNGSGYVWVGSGETMEAGRGYAVAGSNEATFYGTPNNETITVNIHEYNNTGSFSLIGNPYPSAINAQEFMDENDAELEGTIYLWSFNTEDNSGEKQYIAVNAMGSNSTTDPTQNLSTTNIASCQGFFVETDESQAEGTVPVVFKNRMRNGDNNKFKSSGGYEFLEKNWIYAKNENQDTAAVLYAILDEASNKFDEHMDAIAFSSYFRVTLETEAGNQSIMAIPEVDRTQQFPLNLKVSRAGTHEIGMKQVVYNQKGAFQPILLDSETGVVTELDQDSYEVELPQGEINNRFFIIFARTGTTTDIEALLANTQARFVSDHKTYFSIKSAEGKETFNYQLTNAKGQVLWSRSIISGENVDISHLATGIYMVQYTVPSGVTETEKIIIH